MNIKTVFEMISATFPFANAKLVLFLNTSLLWENEDLSLYQHQAFALLPGNVFPSTLSRKTF